MTLVKRFISHYMFVEPISKDENFCRWSAEEMRSNKGVWITEYFAVSNEKKSELLHIASEIKRLSLPVTVRVLDVFSEDNSFFIVTEIPKSKLLVPMDRFDTDRFRLIGGNLLKAFVILQRNGIGIEELSLSDIFVDENRDIQLMITKGWVIKSAKESRENEIILFAVVLLNYLGFKDDEKVEITRESLKEFVPEKIYPLFEEILITRQVQRFESLSRYFQEKMKVTVDSVMDADETEHSISNRMMGYIMLGITAVIMYVTLSSNNDITHSTRFDVWRYQVFANIGISEPQRILGELYEKGYGVDKDMRLSVEWYRKAAQSGNVYAQMSLGHFYDQGIGVLADRKQALYWFTLAATNGDELAKKNIEIINKNSEVPRDTSEMIPMKNEQKQSTTPTRRYHTYWLHSGSSNNLQKSNLYGGIFGCYEEGLKNPVELVTFNHDVRSMAVDGEGNLYWADITTGQIMKSDPNGQDVKAIVGRLFHPMGIAIDKKRKLLFWSDRQQNRGGFSGGIGRSDLDGNNAKYIVVNGLVSGGKLKVDENEGKLFIPDIDGKKIVRVNEDGQNMIGLVFVIKPEGFDIDIQRRKLYWTDDLNSGIYESDYDGGNKHLVYTYYTTFENFETVMYNPSTQRIYFGKLGPASQSIGYVSIYNEMSARLQEYVTNFKIHDIIRN